MKHPPPSFLCGLVAVILLCLASTAVLAQENDTRLLQTFIDISQKSTFERQQVFTELSNADQIRLHRLDNALFLMNRNDLSKNQQDLLIRQLSKREINLENKIIEHLLDKNGFDKKINTLLFGKESLVSISDLGKFIDINKSKSANEIRNVLNDESAEFRKSYWRIKLALHLATEKYSPAQYELFLEMSSILGNELMYTDYENKEFQARLDSHAKRAMYLFVPADAFRIFMSPGGELSCSPPISETESANFSGSCTCLWTLSCGVVAVCSDIPGCTPVSGCGSGGGSLCTGVCVYIPIID